MNTADEAVPIAQADLTELSAEIRRTRLPRRIAQPGAGDLILLEARAYDELQEAIAIANALLSGADEVAAGRTISDDEAQATFKAAIEAAAPRSRPIT
jgi:PHD/YefM family antitoxin component YafN of YafNO toxin-antitoxin module